uniref:Uncharacterized protein n=1 Tax=Anguilla anguilla TaxID=7936 RepID=A0A0E9VIN8_ANGAN
MGDPSLVYH